MERWQGERFESRHSAMGNLICFPVSHANLFVQGGPESIAKLDGGHDRIFSPLDPPQELVDKRNLIKFVPESLESAQLY